MTALGHVAGLPIEEAVLSLAPAAGVLWLAARTWLTGLLPRGRRDHHEGSRP